jgi:adenylate kinase family enzyme
MLLHQVVTGLAFLSLAYGAVMESPEEEGREARLFVIRVTRTLTTSVTSSTSTTSIARCYLPAAPPICSKRKREVILMRNPITHEQMQSLEEYRKSRSLETENSPIELESSAPDTVSEHVEHARLLGVPGNCLRKGRLFARTTHLSTTTLTSTTTTTTTFNGATMETISYLKCRAPNDPLSPICS